KAFAKVRGRKKAINKIIELVGERGKDLEDQIIGVVHGDREEEAIELAEILKEKYKVKEVIISYVGCAIGAHTGPGVIAAVFENESDGEFKKYLN
ncbi:DegV family protein, partial [Anaerofustis stercorihominis]